jgi:hypothetical protein
MTHIALIVSGVVLLLTSARPTPRLGLACIFLSMGAMTALFGV